LPSTAAADATDLAVGISAFLAQVSAAGLYSYVTEVALMLSRLLCPPKTYILSFKTAVA